MISGTGAGQKTTVLAALISKHANEQKFKTILVVGCGNGSDAHSLAEHFGCQVTAIDLEDYYDNIYNDRVTFSQMDACNMRFEPSCFDLVYSFHALEHIPDYKKAISEMRRVLRPGGTFCIGTPNRSRVAGYVGVPGCSLRAKIGANARDWAIRFRGKFRNEFGAHA